MTIDDFLDELERVRRSGPGWTALCPAHEDNNPSLSVKSGDDGRILVYCFAGCTVQKICASLGLLLVDLFPGEPLSLVPAAPRSREERQAAENRRLRQSERALRLERDRGQLALYYAACLIAALYGGDPAAVFDRFWNSAVAELEQRATDRARAAS